MTTCSVADARAQLPSLIDRALQGEEVVIPRHGEAVAELRPTRVADVANTQASYAWLVSRRRARIGVGLSSVELLDEMYVDLSLYLDASAVVPVLNEELHSDGRRSLRTSRAA